MTTKKSTEGQTGTGEGISDDPGGYVSPGIAAAMAGEKVEFPLPQSDQNAV